MWNNRHFIFKVAHCNVFGIRYAYFSHVLNCINPCATYSNYQNLTHI